MHDLDVIRPCAVRGLFYEADSDKLKKEIAGMFGRVERKHLGGSIHGLISPHAGYMYSGFTAAHGYAQLPGKQFETVIVISPSHRELFRGVSVYSGDGYETPFGTIRVNGNLRDELIKATPLASPSVSGHGDEHAIEVQLPFLHEALGDFLLLPIVMGEQTREVNIGLGEALASIVDPEKVLLVASSDLSHYHSVDKARDLDEIIMKDISKFDYENLMTNIRERKTEACGGGPSVALMVALSKLGISKMEILHYSNSGDTSGDFSNVVGYLSAAAYG